MHDEYIDCVIDNTLIDGGAGGSWTIDRYFGNGTAITNSFQGNLI